MNIQEKHLYRLLLHGFQRVQRIGAATCVVEPGHLAEVVFQYQRSEGFIFDQETMEHTC